MFELALGCASAGVVWLTLYPLTDCLARRQVVDLPNERSSHAHPTPRGGGLPVVVVALGGGIAFALYRPQVWSLAYTLCFVAAGLIAAVSWRDDLKSLPSGLRLGVHTIAALLAIWGFGHCQTIELPVIGELALRWLGLPITLLWIVGLTNAYNFMDGIDGIAGGQAVVAGLGWAAIGWLSGQELVCVLGILLAGSSLGFLLHNWPPARIFMGDVGSAFLGYAFAVLPSMASGKGGRYPAIGLLLVWPFVFDSVFTVLRRLGRGENVFQAHRSHLYQRLVIAGYSHRFVTSLYLCWAVAGASLAVTWSASLPGSEVSVPIIIPASCLALWLFVIRAERVRAAEQHSR